MHEFYLYIVETGRDFKIQYFLPISTVGLKAPFVCAQKNVLRTYSLVSFSLCRKCKCLTMIFVKSVEILRKFTIKAYLI